MSATSIKFLHINYLNPNLRSRQRVAHNPIVASMKMGGDHGGEWRHSGRLVDENMIVLRRRIHEMKMKEEENCAPPRSSRWWAWEKQWYKRYSSDVVEIVGLLQIAVMHGRPILVLGAGAFLVICIVLAIYVILCTLLHILFLGHAIF